MSVLSCHATYKETSSKWRVGNNWDVQLCAGLCNAVFQDISCPQAELNLHGTDFVYLGGAADALC